MRIYILRHGVAVESSPGLPDSRRALTRDGSMMAAEFARTFVKAGLDPDVILSSPYLRAFQTAEITRSAFNDKPEFTVLESLAPSGSHLSTICHLEKIRKQSVMLVGHMPDLSELGSMLVCGNISMNFGLKKNALLILNMTGVPGVDRAESLGIYNADDPDKLLSIKAKNHGDTKL